MLPCQRDKFSLPDDLHYLNCAYMAPLARSVEAAGIEGMRSKRVPSGIGPDAFFDESDEVRRLFGQLVNAPAERIALIPAASYGLATAARNLPLHRQQNVVMVEEQFPSNVYTWMRATEAAGATLRRIAAPKGMPRGARWNERLLEAIDVDTAVVTLGVVHWADGTRFDLEAIGGRAREVGAALIIDGTQSVGALPFDVTVLQPDALVCAGYKWLLGPYSIGAAYFGPRFDDGVPLEENWITRRGSENFAGLVRYEPAYQPGAIRYDVGERSNFILTPMLAAALRLVLDWQPARIQEYCTDLMRDVLDEARALGFQVEDRDRRSAHLFGIRLPPEVSAARLREALAACGVSVSVRGDAIRISPHVYNDTSDVDALREALHWACHA